MVEHRVIGPLDRAAREAEAARSRGAAIVPFLSLFLLLLAFFLLLNSMTRFVPDRTHSVLGSLSQTFRTDMFGIGGARLPTPFEGAEQLEFRITDILTSVVPVADLTVTRSGTELFVSFPDGELFMPGDRTLRPDRGPLLDQLAMAVIDAEPGLRNEIEIQIGYGTGTVRWRTFATQRAGLLARAFAARGVDDAAIAAGLRDAPHSQLRLVFTVHAADGPPA